MAPKSVTSWRKMAGAGGIGSMRGEILCWKGWRSSTRGKERLAGSSAAASSIGGERNTSIRLLPCSTITNLLVLASRSKAGDEALIRHYVRHAWTLVIGHPRASMLITQHVARDTC